MSIGLLFVSFFLIECVIAAPYTPSNPTPDNGSIGISVMTDLSWIGGGSDHGKIKYDVYFGTTNPPPKVKDNQSKLTYNPSGTLSYNTEYFWRIVAWDSYNNFTAGPLWDFTTVSQSNQPPNTPSNPSPSDGSTGVSVSAGLSWTGGDPNSDAVTYDVYFGNTSLPLKVVSNQSALNYDLGTLSYNTHYYWRIVAWDAHGASTAGLLWDFTTVSQSNQPPNTPSNPSPSDGSTGVSVSAGLSWTGGDPNGDSVTYDVYFGVISPSLKVISNQSSNSYNPGTMNYLTTYYWKIIAWDSHYIKTISPTWHFTTISSGGGGDGGGGGGDETPNKKPIAELNAGEPYNGLVNTEITFDGSNSNDSDGTITNWFWDFGDNTSGTGKISNHSFLKTGKYTVTLIVTDNKGATNKDTSISVITQPNRPPTPPTITGPENGTKNTIYTYTAVSTDADNDSIQYAFDWGDPLSFNQLSGFLPNGSGFTIHHSWAAAGRYNVTVTVTDNHTTSSSKITVYIDAVQTGNIGYLLDNNSDGIYDAFYSDASKQITPVQAQNGNYSIDSDGDGDWDYIFSSTNEPALYQEPPPGIGLIFISGTIVVISIWITLVLLWKGKSKKKIKISSHSHKKR
jgi:PKD repeat protein